MFKGKISVIMVLVLLVLVMSGTVMAKQVSLKSGGASFPYPLYSKWMDVYTENNDVKIDYQSIGSGGGIRGIIDGTFDYAGSDAPMKDEELEKADKDIMHIPTVMGAVVVTYNLPEVEEEVK
ncbi:MAG: substrate-binding domain-containing protein, partial [Halanaerobiales bacterium]